jgi:hypothetical protein
MVQYKEQDQFYDNGGSVLQSRVLVLTHQQLDHIYHRTHSRPVTCQCSVARGIKRPMLDESMATLETVTVFLPTAGILDDIAAAVFNLMATMMKGWTRTMSGRYVWRLNPWTMIISTASHYYTLVISNFHLVSFTRRHYLPGFVVAAVDCWRR